MKRLTALLIALIMLLALGACGKDSDEKKGSTPGDGEPITYDADAQINWPDTGLLSEVPKALDKVNSRIDGSEGVVIVKFSYDSFLKYINKLQESGYRYVNTNGEDANIDQVLPQEMNPNISGTGFFMTNDKIWINVNFYNQEFENIQEKHEFSILAYSSNPFAQK